MATVAAAQEGITIVGETAEDGTMAEAIAEEAVLHPIGVVVGGNEACRRQTIDVAHHPEVGVAKTMQCCLYAETMVCTSNVCAIACTQRLLLPKTLLSRVVISIFALCFRS